MIHNFHTLRRVGIAPEPIQRVRELDESSLSATVEQSDGHSRGGRGQTDFIRQYRNNDDRTSYDIMRRIIPTSVCIKKEKYNNNNTISFLFL